jgi:Kinesin-associated
MGWEERLKETEARQKEQEDDLRAAGIATGAERDANLERAKTVPHVVNLHEDAAMNETIHYFFEPGVCAVTMSWPSMLCHHCIPRPNHALWS